MVSRHYFIYIIQILLFEEIINNIFAGLLKEFQFHQTDYLVTLERTNLTFVNKSYLHNANLTRIFVTRYKKKYSASVVVIQDLDIRKIDLFIEGRKYQSNEYRLFPFNYTENSCVALYAPKFGNFLDQCDCNVKKTCDLKKGFYICSNIHMTDANFPPFAPRGRFKLTMHLIYHKNILLCSAEYFIEIKPSNPLERVIGA